MEKAVEKAKKDIISAQEELTATKQKFDTMEEEAAGVMELYNATKQVSYSIQILSLL